MLKFIDIIKKNIIHITVACVIFFAGMVFLYKNLSLFTGFYQSGVNVCDQKYWKNLSTGEAESVEFIADYKQLNRFCLLFRKEQDVNDVTVNIVIKQNENIIYNENMMLVTGEGEEIQQWFISGVFLDKGKRYSLEVSLADTINGNFLIRTDERQNITAAMEYAFIQKGYLMACILLLFLSCLLLVFYRFPHKIRFKNKKWIDWVYIFLIPGIYVLLFEWICNQTVLKTQWFVCNYFIVLFFVILIWIFSPTMSVVIGICSFFTYLSAVLNYQVLYYRDRPLLPWDINSASTAFNVASQYRIILTIPMIVSFLILLILGMMYFCLPVENMRKILGGGTSRIRLLKEYQKRR